MDQPKLQKHFLLAVSSDQSYHYGTRFLGYFFQNKASCRVDLLSIVSHPEESIENKSELHPEQLSKMQTSRQAQGRQVLQSAADKLESLGFVQDNLKANLHAKTFSTVQDLVFFAQKGLYDSLILGRRGISLLENLFQDSVSSRVLDEQCNIPIWICREPRREKKDVLLCTDGSEPSLSIADHVGFVLQDEPHHNVTILYARSPKDNAYVDNIMHRTRERLTDNAVPESRIQQKVIQGRDASQAILNYAREQNFAVLAMGRRGRDKQATGWRRLFMGSVSEAVLKNLNQASLWIHQ